MRMLFPRIEISPVAQFTSILTDDPAQTPGDIFRRCAALESLSALGSHASEALPAIQRTLFLRISVDCGLALHVAVAEALWKVGRQRAVALPILAWALKDDYWGASYKAAQILGEMASEAHEVIPEIVALAERRLSHGPYSFEMFRSKESRSMLAVIAVALGKCGLGRQYIETARATLSRLAVYDEADARTEAKLALSTLGDLA